MAIDKAVDSTVLDGYFSDIADAIRDKAESSDTYTPAQMPQAIASLPGGNAELEALLAGEASGDVTVRGVTDLHMTRIVCGGGDHLNDITALHMPDLEEWCWSNTNYIDGSGGLIDNSNAMLVTLDLPECKTLFISNKTNGNSDTFKLLAALNAPKLEKLAGRLRGSALTAVRFPRLKFIHDSVFYIAGNLITADFGSSSITGTDPFTIRGSVFSNSGLDALVLRYGSQVRLPYTNDFTNTPIARGTGYIYVPRDLIATYEAATNWSTYAGQFRALEDYTDDGTTSGEFIHP